MAERYYPEDLPEADLAALRVWLAEELNRVSLSVNELVDGFQEVIYEAPTRPREGDIRRSDGTYWDPTGNGHALVWYDGTKWRWIADTLMTTGTDAPASTDNGSKGYVLGSINVNTSAGAAYILASWESANGSANWVAIT